MPLPTMQAGTTIRGIASMLLAGVFLVTNDAIIKTLVSHYPVGQILCLQAACIAILTGLWLRAIGKPILRFANPRGHLARGLLYVVGSFAFVTALNYLPLGEVIAIAFAGPLFLTLFGRLILKEHVGPHRLAAVVIGFIGVVIMMRPSPNMHWAVFLPILVALADGLRDIITRTTTVGESSQRIVFSTAGILCLAGAVTAVGGDWVAIASDHVLRFIVSSCAFVLAHYFLVESFRHAQTVIVAPFRYTQLVWGILIGWYFFGETLDTPIFFGAGIIIAAGLYIGWREAVHARRTQTL